MTLPIGLQQYLPFTVLKQCPHLIEYKEYETLQQYLPFTVLKPDMTHSAYSVLELQQYLLFTVLKPFSTSMEFHFQSKELQQYLPFTVLKLICTTIHLLKEFSCNSIYRLRYATKGARQQRSKATMRTAHL